MVQGNLFFLIVVGAFVAAASAYVGSLMVLKRMALVGDALTHVALPGMAIAISLNINPTIGAFVALTLAVVGIWYLEKSSDVYPEALVGVVFTASLALGVLLTDEVELLEALFGTIEKLSYVDGLISIVLSIFVIIATFMLSKKILITIISEEMATTSGVNVAKTNLIYMFLVGLIVSLGIKFVGTLLMGALVIIPAVAAKNLTKNINNYFLYSVIFGILSAVIGIFLASNYSLPVGAIVVLISVVLYILTHVFKKS
jgi:ABC-type Mn2+/Zn2+ transport systems, permease components